MLLRLIPLTFMKETLMMPELISRNADRTPITPELTSEDFTAYFHGVHGQEPFPWQQRLTDEVLHDNEWPAVIDLPTGTGKTAVLDTALFALAVRPEVFPRRIVFVIDRRIVVDQVLERAMRIEERIRKADPSCDSVLCLMHDRLKRLGGKDAPILGVAALRGGIPIDRGWAERPDVPWLIVSTVDQFGSRLLFRGYGASRGIRPIQAGLTGNDCLVLLDEVHLSLPFAQTLQAVDSFNRGTRLRRRFFVVEMSATPSRADGRRLRLTDDEDRGAGCEGDHSGADGRSFRLTDDDLEESLELRRRVLAAKSATIEPVSSAKPPHEAIAARVKRILKSELDGTARSVGVIVNRILTAREVHRCIDGDFSAHLLTGRMRPLDRARVLAEIGSLIDPNRNHPSESSEVSHGSSHELQQLALGLKQSDGTPPGSHGSSRGKPDNDRPSVVVATQAIEVGADFSFDALITEVAPIDSLRQRFGRLDRRGTLAKCTGEPAKAWIIGVKSTLNPRRPDPIYAHSARVTWDHLQQAYAERGPIDFTPRPASPLEFPDGAKAPERRAPLLLDTYMNAWVQTDPEPIVQPAVEWFLHGIDTQQDTDVTVVWRYDRSPEALQEVPLRPAEHLQVPIEAARSWLMGAREEAPVADVTPVADVDIDREHGYGPERGIGRDWIRWRGHDTPPEQMKIYPRDIQPGDVLVVDPERGGLSAGTWDPSATNPVEDLGDEAQHAYGKRFTLRLDQRMLPKALKAAVLDTAVDDDTLGRSHPRSAGHEMPRPADEADADDPLEERVDDWLSDMDRLAQSASSGPTEWWCDTIRRLRQGHVIRTITGDGGTDDGYYVLVAGKAEAAAMDGSDQSLSCTGAGVTLRDHLDGVGERAAAYARRLGLSDETAADLALAGRLHDLGKADRRWQEWILGGDEVYRAMHDEPVAKSPPGVTPERRSLMLVRHEIMSVAMIDSNPDVLADAHDPDLVIHLVGTHHGHARPLPPVPEDPKPETVGFEHDGKHMETSSHLVEGPLALDMADRFWRLIDRYGPHGLAWLEAILRLADWQQSAQEKKQ